MNSRHCKEGSEARFRQATTKGTDGKAPVYWKNSQPVSGISKKEKGLGKPVRRMDRRRSVSWRRKGADPMKKSKDRAKDHVQPRFLRM